MQEQINNLTTEIGILKNKVATLEIAKIGLATDPITTKALIELTKDQIIISGTPTMIAPTGSIAIKPTATKQLWVKTDTGWVQIV